MRLLVTYRRKKISGCEKRSKSERRGDARNVSASMFGGATAVIRNGRSLRLYGPFEADDTVGAQHRDAARQLFDLKWADVDFVSRSLTVSGCTTKSGKTRRIPLNNEAIDVLSG